MKPCVSSCRSIPSSQIRPAFILIVLRSAYSRVSSPTLDIDIESCSLLPSSAEFNSKKQRSDSAQDLPYTRSTAEVRSKTCRQRTCCGDGGGSRTQPPCPKRRRLPLAGSFPHPLASAAPVCRQPRKAESGRQSYHRCQQNQRSRLLALRPPFDSSTSLRLSLCLVVLFFHTSCVGGNTVTRLASSKCDRRTRGFRMSAVCARA